MPDERRKIDESVFDFIYGMALNDATNRTAGIKSGDKGDLLEIDKIKEAVRDYAEGIINNAEGVNFEDAVNKIQDANLKSKKYVECFCFGKIQKLVNMTIKYLYIRYYDDSIFRKALDNCDAPMDSIMMDFVFESYFFVQGIERKRGETPGFNKETPCWSSFKSKEDGYQAFQEAIDRIIKEKQLGINRIEFDFQYWEKAKSFHSALAEEKKRLLKEIWNE